ncbi:MULTISPECIES: DUF3892 domain-containing protein [Amycolatopsis]|uniref:DUF3892 domain-containing protein n=1 Tax=Amycolatopsis albidoflavus TaxID=102226 RepID=A0ABW5ICD2_9PSEU
MARVKVEYTHKLGSNYNPHERILGVAGDAGRGWYRTTDEVIREIRAGLNSYFVSVGGRQVDVIVASYNGRPYIKTESDGYAPNNLLNLPEPPSRLIP